jgi:hypothetical protein
MYTEFGRKQTPLQKWRPCECITMWENDIKMELRKTCYEDGRWMELAQDHVQWRALVLAALNLRVLLPES